MSKKYKIIDLFAGCGGLKDGFLQSGKFESVASVEWLKPQVDTLRNRLKTKWKYQDADKQVLYFDIQREEELFKGWCHDEVYGSSAGLDSMVEAKDGVDVIVGGPPCQAYSIAGRVRDEAGMSNDYRNFLFEHYLNIVNRYKPKVFIFENVTGILSAKPQGINIIEEITKAFKEIGYSIPKNIKSTAVLNCSEYGVPQNRKRVIILGVRNELLNGDDKPINEIVDSFYLEFLPKYKSTKKITVEEAIGDLEKYHPNYDDNSHKLKKAYQGNSVVNWHKPRYHSVRDMNIFSMLAKDIETGSHQFTNAEAITKIYEEHVGSKSPIHRYHVLRKDEPSTTIIAHLYKDGNRYIHYDSSQARTITPREAARLQSFDDDFEFIGNQGNVYQMIGNAVPPKLGLALSKALNDFLRTYFR